ncbi:MAG: AAA family ATPase [Dehalococcoidia bacterium]|nr:AAA family ATPase [Dehalococcoidia bacterium]
MKIQPGAETVVSEVISSGHPEIDRKLGGGIPSGSLTLIEGQSDAGKSVLAQQLMWGSLIAGHRVVLVSTENTVRSFNNQMQSLGLGILDQLILGWIKVFSVESARAEKRSTFETVLRVIDAYPDYDVIVIDSLTPVIVHNDLESVLRYFDQCKKRCDKGKTILNIAHSYAFAEDLLIRLRSVCDAHFKLHIEEIGDKLVKVLDVAKVRGADQQTGTSISFDVVPGIGMRIMPLGKAKA